jgi:DNA-binding XRE family transcriptional regulator
MSKHESPVRGNDASPLHNRIPVLRAERGLSRQQLADLVGVNYQTVGYLERGAYNPSLELAFRIAEVFELPIEAVFARAPFPPLSAVVYARPTSPHGHASAPAQMRDPTPDPAHGPAHDPARR